MGNEEPTVWFIAEEKEGKLSPLTFGLAAEARRLARGMEGAKIAGVVLGEEAANLAPTLPADAVYFAEDPKLSSCEAAARSLAEFVRERQPSVILFAGTSTGNEIASRLSALIGSGLACGCLRLDAGSGGTVRMLRPVYGGRASCTVVSRPGQTQIATIIPDALSTSGQAGAANPEVIALTPNLNGFRPSIINLGVRRPPPSHLDVAQAEIVVSGGRGVGGAEGFKHLEDLAGLLGGAVAASRPAVDAGWAGFSRQIGSSGKVVKPRLYIACGISGAPQHLHGMRESEMIIAVNQDAYAPITSMAALTLVGDLNQIVPALTERLGKVVQAQSYDDQMVSQEPGVKEMSAGSVRCIAVLMSKDLEPNAKFDSRNPSEIEALPRVVNAADLNALEAALQAKDRFPHLRVVALHLGPPEGEFVLREALALGADDAIRLWDDSFTSSDSLASARIITAAIRKLNAGLVVAGSRGGDAQSGQLPMQIGAMLGAAAATELLEVDFGRNGRVFVEKKLEWGKRAMLDLETPAVLGVEPEINRPRYPRLRLFLKSRACEIECWDRNELGMSESDVGLAGSGVEIQKVGPPKPVAKARPGGGQGMFDSPWASSGGGGGKKQDKVVQGTPEELAEACYRFLTENALIAVEGGS